LFGFAVLAAVFDQLQVLVFAGGFNSGEHGYIRVRVTHNMGKSDMFARGKWHHIETIIKLLLFVFTDCFVALHFHQNRLF